MTTERTINEEMDRESPVHFFVNNVHDAFYFDALLTNICLYIYDIRTTKMASASRLVLLMSCLLCGLHLKL